MKRGTQIDSKRERERENREKSHKGIGTTKGNIIK